MTEEAKEEKQLVKAEPVLPAMNVGQAVQLWETYQELIGQLKTDGDFVAFGGKDCPTKQWRTKLERFFALSCELLKEWHEEERDNTRTYYVTARAMHPNGAHHDATGTCNTREKRGPRLFHDARSHAETRAKNRAILEMVGYGAVSAEEMDTAEHKPRPAAPEREPEPWDKPAPPGLGKEQAVELEGEEAFAEPDEPTCKICDRLLVRRISQSKQNPGREFWACPDKCKVGEGVFQGWCDEPKEAA